MLDDMLITVDVLKYDIPEQYEGLFHCYVHEFDRIVYGNFSPLGNSTNFYFLHMGYKKNINLLLSLEEYTSDIIALKNEAKDCVITNLHTYEMQFIGTFIGYEQKNEEKIAKILANDFIFKIKCSKNTEEKKLIQGQKVYFKSLIRLEVLEDFHKKIDDLYKNVRLSFEELEGWPKDKSLWPDPELKLEKGDSPLEQLIIRDPEYIMKKLGRSHCKHYPITLKVLPYELLDKIDEEDLKEIEHLIQK